MSTAIRFATYADSTAGPMACWPWTGARNQHGYGVLRVDGRLERASRVALALDDRPVPKDAEACHECDNPACVNPAHLYIGNRSTNMADMRNRGRSNVGERNGAAKLTRATVERIRAQRVAGAPYADLAVEHGVSKSTIARVVTRQGWS